MAGRQGSTSAGTPNSVVPSRQRMSRLSRLCWFSSLYLVAKRPKGHEIVVLNRVIPQVATGCLKLNGVRNRHGRSATALRSGRTGMGKSKGASFTAKPVRITDRLGKALVLVYLGRILRSSQLIASLFLRTTMFKHLCRSILQEGETPDLVGKFLWPRGVSLFICTPNHL